MSNTGRTVSDVKSPGEIKVSLLSMIYHSSDQNTIDVCTETVRLIIDQQLRLASFEKELTTAEKRVADQLKLIEVAGKRIDELELALRYYANECHFKNGGVPCYIYALDDAGHIARNALGIDQKEVDRRVLATYYKD